MLSLAKETANGIGHVWRDAVGLPGMVNLPAGEFVMGENVGDKFANDTERPTHRVNFANDFALGSFPVTVGEFGQFRSAHAPEEADDLPVVRVSWHDASAYCEWLSAQTGRSYRLPNEAEWEFACRAGSRAPFACGDVISPLLANYFYDEHGLRIGMGRRTPVGNYAPNIFGLFDLHGNVCEWLADAWHPNYHGAPVNGGAWIEPGDSRHVIRGGAWDYLPRLLRSAWRDWREADFHADNIGFRVATSDLKNPVEATR
ncbi:MAG TPA: formylglycine-generating enzyme family protein [Verrucomicrobiae bacterium]|jgi:formylglycine-generating enzyme required for sulfatase activity|nr:formylglycine-generating enzyme family protein [Verrucomicrobiae bacterium]